MADGQAEGELRDQLGDLEAQLQEIDAVLAATDGAEPELEAVRGELLESVAACRAALPPQGRIVGDGSYASHSHHGTVQIGGTYRFRYVDQHAHIGLVTALHGDQAEVHFLMPTSAAMLAGVQLPAAALRAAAFRQDDVSSLPPGSRVLAQLQGLTDGGVWHECQVVDFAAGGRKVTVRSAADGSTSMLPLSAVAAALAVDSSDDAGADAAGTDRDNDGSGDEGDGGFDEREADEGGDDIERHKNAHAAFAAPQDQQPEGDDEEEEAIPPGAAERLQAALQDDAQAVQAAVRAGGWRGAVLAAFEQHTRGIGSKLLAAMGFVAGAGLGRDGKGIAAPVDVQPRKPGAGLGHVVEEGMRVGARKKRRGGERARRRKFVEALRARKEAARDDAAVSDAHNDGVPQLFSFLNRAVGDGSEAAAVRRRSSGEDKSRGYTVKAPNPAAAVAAESRGSLATQQDALTALRGQVSHLQHMAQRNAKDKVLSQQIGRRLDAAKAQLAARESEHMSARKAIKAKEDQKRWTKF